MRAWEEFNLLKGKLAILEGRTSFRVEMCTQGKMFPRPPQHWNA